MDKIVPIEIIENKIFIIRGLKVMLDRDLAMLYEVETRIINRNVKRNISRFPEDFMFQLTESEWEKLISQNVISILKSQIATSSWGGIRKLPYAFTEHGVAMLSSVLNSKRAIAINIQNNVILNLFQDLFSVVNRLDAEINSAWRDYYLKDITKPVKIGFKS